MIDWWSSILPYIITGVGAVIAALIGQYAFMRRAGADTRKANAEAQKAGAEAAQMFENVASAAAERVLKIDKRLSDVEEKYQNLLIWVNALIDQLKAHDITPITLEEALDNHAKNQKRRATDDTKPLPQYTPGRKGKSL